MGRTRAVIEMLEDENMLCGQLLIRVVVVKNPLAPVEHPGGVGVANELFELALDQFVKGVL